MNNFGKLLITAGLVASPWIIVACGNSSSTEDDGETSGRVGICNSICDRADECDVGSRAECIQTCRDDDVSSSAALQVVEICADDVDCDGFENGDLADCVTEGISDLEASGVVEDYCESYVDWVAECIGESPSLLECYRAANAVSSRYLNDLADCLDKGCAGAPDCVEVVEDRYDIGDSIIALVSASFGGGPDEECCSSGDPCDWANDGICDCGGDFAWDNNDCSSENTNCCASGDPCNWADDGSCDCGGDFAWDNNDCSSPGGDNSCVRAYDGVCDEPDICDAGTDTSDCNGQVEDCCASGDPCGWASDGICDCSGDFAWDDNDCADGDSCTWARDGECDEPNICPTGTDTTDCSGGTGTDSCVYAQDGECDEPLYCDDGTDTSDCSASISCCVAGNPCDWANDGFCDCSGQFAWDDNDCSGTDSDSCVYAFDNVCDEPEFCDPGTDTTDCSNPDSCVYAFDNVCDEPEYCDYGTDTTDCTP